MDVIYRLVLSFGEFTQFFLSVGSFILMCRLQLTLSVGNSLFRLILFQLKSEPQALFR